MVKKLWTFIIVFVVLLFGICTVYGQDEKAEDEKLVQKAQDELLDTSGAKDLYDKIPSDIKKILDENDADEIKNFDTKTILDLSQGDFVKLIVSGVKTKLHAPITILATAVGTILLAALLGSLQTNFLQTGLDRTFNVVTVLCLSSIVITPIVSILRQTAILLEQVSEFLLGFIPIYAGIITVSGKPLSAFAYNGMLLGIVEIVSIVSKNVLIPLCGIYLALCLCGAVSGQVNISGITGGVKTAMTWGLGLSMTIFVALLTIKSFVAGAADSVTMRAGKFLVGSFVPVIGGAISDAFTVLQGSIGVIKATVGSFGIIVVLLCFLPAIVSILLISLAIKAAQLVSETLEVKTLSTLLQATGFVLGIMQSILICYGVMVIISISLMIVLGSGI